MGFIHSIKNLGNEVSKVAKSAEEIIAHPSASDIEKVSDFVSQCNSLTNTISVICEECGLNEEETAGVKIAAEVAAVLL